ncbi:MAG: SlyX family protein [Pedosphaera sp.]|nr:SlyX family protein [Pedosphaera sp.]
MNADPIGVRLEALERSHAYLEKLVGELNHVIVEQGRALHTLQKRLQGIGDSLDRQELDRIRASSTKPPHY